MHQGEIRRLEIATQEQNMKETYGNPDSQIYGVLHARHIAIGLEILEIFSRGA